MHQLLHQQLLNAIMHSPVIYLPLSELNTRYDRSSKQLVTNESHRTGWAGEQLSQLCTNIITIVHNCHNCAQLSQLCTNINIIIMMSVMVRSRQTDSLERCKMQNAQYIAYPTLLHFVTLYWILQNVIVQLVDWTE